MKIKLIVFERFMVLGAFIPTNKKDSYYNLKYLRELREELSLSLEEYEKYKPFVIKENEAGGIVAKWSEINKVIPEKEFDFAEWLFHEIREKLKKDSESDPPKLTDDKISLFEKFVLVDIKPEPEKVTSDES